MERLSAPHALRSEVAAAVRKAAEQHILNGGALSAREERVESVGIGLGLAVSQQRNKVCRGRPRRSLRNTRRRAKTTSELRKKL